MSKLTLPLEVGKKYVRRDGQIVTLTQGRRNSKFPFDYTLPDGTIGGLTPTGQWALDDESPADLVADYIEPAKNQGHPHAESMRLYAEDATETATPWDRWEVCLSGGWEELTVQPSWAPHFQYRRKPKTIRIGEFDVPEPMREIPPLGATVFVADPSIKTFAMSIAWGGNHYNEFWLRCGFVHETPEAAVLHAKALISLTSKEAL